MEYDDKKSVILLEDCLNRGIGNEWIVVLIDMHQHVYLTSNESWLDVIKLLKMHDDLIISLLGKHEYYNELSLINSYIR